MRGRKTSEADKEKLRTIIYMYPTASKAELSRLSGIPETTVYGLLNDETFLDKDKFEEIRAEKKREFISRAWELIQKSLNKLDEKLESLTPEQLQKTNIRDIAITIGTIYDKQALALGEATVISERKEPTQELIKEYEDKLQQLKKLIS